MEDCSASPSARVEAIAEAIASRLEAIVTRVEAMATRVKISIFSFREVLMGCNSSAVAVPEAVAPSTEAQNTKSGMTRPAFMNPRSPKTIYFWHHPSTGHSLLDHLKPVLNMVSDSQVECTCALLATMPPHKALHQVVAVESLDDGLDRLPELSVSQPLHAPDDAAASTGQKSHFEERTRVLTVRRGVRARATPNRAVRAPILESAVESADGISGPLFPIGREDEPRVPMASPEREARDAKSEALRVTKPSPTVARREGPADGNE